MRRELNANLGQKWVRIRKKQIGKRETENYENPDFLANFRGKSRISQQNFTEVK